MRPRPGAWGTVLPADGDADVLSCSYRGATYTFAHTDAVLVGVSLPAGALAYLGMRTVIGHVLPQLSQRVVTTIACAVSCVGLVAGGLPLGCIVAVGLLVLDAYRIERAEGYGVQP